MCYLVSSQFYQLSNESLKVFDRQIKLEVNSIETDLRKFASWVLAVETLENERVDPLFFWVFFFVFCWVFFFFGGVEVTL